MDGKKETPHSQIKQMRCLVCNSAGVDVAHVKTRGSGGCDEKWNLMPLCREHHSLQHKVGILTFIRLHPSVQAYLDLNGWYVENGKLFNNNSDLSSYCANY